MDSIITELLNRNRVDYFPSLKGEATEMVCSAKPCVKPDTFRERFQTIKESLMKNTVRTFKKAKEDSVKLTVLTASDYPMAKLMDEAGINGILVGDSLGMVSLGYKSTLPVSMEDMIHDSRAVARGAESALVITDLPFMSYQTSVYDAVFNSGRLVKEGNAQAVKLEGGEAVAPQIRAIVDAGIPVMGHIGLTPQSINALGGFAVQGKDEETARGLLRAAKSVEEAGSFSLVL